MESRKHCTRILSVVLLITPLTGLCLGQERKETNEVRQLELKKSVERELSTGEVHSYSIVVTVGQLLDVVVNQRGIDVVVDVFAGDRKVLEVDSPNGSEGPEAVLMIAEVTATYVLQVRALEKGASGHYAITFNDRRIPTDQDRKHFDDLAKLAEAQRLENQWWPLYGEGRYAEAIPFAERVLAMREAVLGPNHPDVAVTLNSLATLYQDTNDYARAESLLRRSLSIDEAVFGKDHPNLAIAYGNLSTLYYSLGDYQQSEVLMKKSLALREQAFGHDHPDVALSLHNLARLYQAKGDLVGAETFCRQAIAIYRKVYPADHPDLARSLETLAEVFRARGDFDHAEPLYQQALAIYEKSGARGDFWSATARSDLATMYQEQGSYDKAEQLFNSVLSTYEKTLGKEHPDYAQVLNNLAAVYDSKGEYDRAEELHQRSLAIRKKRFGAESSSYAESLINLAQVYWHRHDVERARDLTEQGIVILERTLGRNHPTVGVAYSNLAVNQIERKDVKSAVRSLSRVNAIEEHNLRLILTTGSEEQKQIFLNKLSGTAEYMVSLNVLYEPNNEEAAELSLTSILQRKGRALDAMFDQIGNLRQRASVEDGALLDRLTSVRSRLATLQIFAGGKLRPEDRAAEISKLETENEQIETAISQLGGEFQAESQPVDVKRVRQALPAATALVEFVLFRAFDLQRRGVIGEQYAAYVLLPNSSKPLLVSLGDASTIDDKIQHWLLALSDSKRVDAKDLGRSLDEKVMRPVRRLLGSVRHVFVSADGALNLVPFAALVDENNHYLVENYSITYLTSGRDLFRLQVPRNSQASNVVVVADPLFDLASAPGNGSVASASKPQSARVDTPSQRSLDFAALDYRLLPGTAAEATMLRSLWPSATVWTGVQANEAALKQVKNPMILHIATHGFFLPNKSTPNKPSKSNESIGGGSSVDRGTMPLLRAGLILAGVKQQASGEGQDGVLTALELAGLNLWGTKLVVLSACETGLGDVKRGEGVYGLRRALVLAGSASQVITLWKVSDAGTRDLMSNYYQRLQAGEGRTEALRRVQLMMLRGQLKQAAASGNRGTIDTGENVTTKNYRHPYYWAAFIQSGDWRSMDH